MPVTVVVGGQYGSEGKGKVAFEWVQRRNAKIAIRVGGPNSGHTVIDPRSGQPVIFRQLPTAALLRDVVCVIPAGAYIDVDVLSREIEITGILSDRLIIDPRAVVVTDRERNEERDAHLREQIGSTLSGTGAAVRRRVARDGTAFLAREMPALERYIRPTATTLLLRDHLSRGARIVIEGTQGFGLSLLHSPHYPKATSRDTTASAFVSEAGLSPLDVDEVVMVIRTFPIRVAGNSGPLSDMSWEAIGRASGHGPELLERTSVTKKTRRIGAFDRDIVLQAIAANNPSKIVLNHIDYFDSKCANTGKPTSPALEAVAQIENSLGRKIDFLGLSPSLICERPSDSSLELAS